MIHQDESVNKDIHDFRLPGPWLFQITTSSIREYSKAHICYAPTVITGQKTFHIESISILFGLKDSCCAHR
jgi:hypothetical protein